MTLPRPSHLAPAAPTSPGAKRLWIHATTPARLLALRDVAARLRSQYPDLSVISTWEKHLPDMPTDDSAEIAYGVLPDYTLSETRAFLEHWAPDLCIWAGGHLRRGLSRLMAEADIPTVLTDITLDELPTRASRWWPDQRAKLLSSFSAILSPSEAVAENLKRTGIPPHRISVTGPLGHASQPPGCAQADLDHMQKTLAARPVWLAAHVTPKELPAVLSAHRSALKLLHRLLLIVSCEDRADLDAARAIIHTFHMRFADWDNGDDPSENNQVLLCDNEDLGLWYRLSPVTLITGSSKPTFVGHSPLDSAALGSAILFEHSGRKFGEIYRALKEHGAAVQIRSNEELTCEILRLSSPDQAAEMALAGWTFVTQGTRTIDRLLEIAQDLLDMPDITDETA